MILRAFLLALQSLTDRRIMTVFLKCIGVTVLILLAAGFVFWQAFYVLFDKLHFGIVGAGYVLATLAMLLLAWLLWRVIAVTVLWFFSDDIVNAVEARYYPAYAMLGKRPDMAVSGAMALRSLARLIGYNVIALPLYLILLITGVGTALAILIVNSYLLGRDLQDMVSARHGPQKAAFGGVPRFVLGLLGTAGMLVPFVNLLVPVVVTAMAVHMAHDHHKF